MIKTVKKLLNLTTMAVAGLVLTACGNLSNVSEKGTTDNPVFPQVNKTGFNHDGTQEGSWVNWQNVRQIEQGMNKDQLYNLIGRPHFSEGLYGVREWDYLFNYRENGVHKQCQYKVLFDKDMNAQEFWWFPNGCNSDHQFSLSADFLFDFDDDKLVEEGKTVVEELAEKLKALNANTVQIIGHTDRMGSEEYNNDLSLRRASTVQQYLQQLGLQTPTTIEGRGESEQVVHCEGEGAAAKECLRPNRRVVVVAKGQEIKAGESTMVPGKIGPSPLYDDKYPYSPQISANPYPAQPAKNLR